MIAGTKYLSEKTMYDRKYDEYNDTFVDVTELSNDELGALADEVSQMTILYHSRLRNHIDGNWENIYAWADAEYLESLAYFNQFTSYFREISEEWHQRNLTRVGE